MPGGLFTFGSASTGVYRVPSHVFRPVNSVKLVVKPTSVTNHFAFHISSPYSRRHRATICARHFNLFRCITALLIVMLLFLIVNFALHPIRPSCKILGLLLARFMMIIVNIRTRWRFARITLFSSSLRFLSTDTRGTRWIAVQGDALEKLQFIK